MTPADARAFLQMTRLGQDTTPIVTAYFRDVEALSAQHTRSPELAFLANALVAGCSVQSRPFTPQEAADAASCICKLGLERWPAPSETNALVIDHNDRSLVTAFELGWSVLYREVGLFVAAQLIATLDGMHSTDAEIGSGLRTLRHVLVRHREAATPWLARNATDVLAMIDMTVWTSVLGLLDECPIVPEAMTAVLERRTTPVRATAFEFISTTAQIGDIRIFMKALPSVLSR